MGWAGASGHVGHAVSTLSGATTADSASSFGYLRGTGFGLTLSVREGGKRGTALVALWATDHTALRDCQICPRLVRGPYRWTEPGTPDELCIRVFALCPYNRPLLVVSFCPAGPGYSSYPGRHGWSPAPYGWYSLALSGLYRSGRV